MRRRARAVAGRRAGEIVGLIGPNGAGKSTTLHAIMGLVPARGRRDPLGGRSLRGRAPEAIARSGIALVPEGRRLFAELTVEENLRLGLGGPLGLGTASRRISPRSTSCSPSCEEFRDDTRARSPAASSSSSRSRARSSRSRPSSCSTSRRSVSPRPSSIGSSRRCGRSRERGLGVLLVEQRAQRTVALADRTYVLANGELRLTLTPDDAADTDRMVAAYLS